MASLADIEAHRTVISQLTTVAQSSLVDLWSSLDLDDPASAARALREAMPELVDAYGSAASSLAADWYEDLREQAEVRGSYAAVVADLPGSDQVQGYVGYALAPMFTDTPDAAKALGLLGGGLQRLVADMDRFTVSASVESDPAQPAWARHASANACAFCAMLATRDAVYTSESSALRVGGRGQDVGSETWRAEGRRRGGVAKGVRLRGSQGLGSSYHDHCHCTAVPVWPGQEIERAPYVDRWFDAYRNAANANATKGQFGAVDVTKVLSAMRVELGAR